MTDSELEDRLFTYLWLSLHTSSAQRGPDCKEEPANLGSVAQAGNDVEQGILARYDQPPVEKKPPKSEPSKPTAVTEKKPPAAETTKFKVRRKTK